MLEDKKNSNEDLYEELLPTDGEAAEANLEIQDDFYSKEEPANPASSPIPYVANNTAPINVTGDKKRK